MIYMPPPYVFQLEHRVVVYLRDHGFTFPHGMPHVTMNDAMPYNVGGLSFPDGSIMFNPRFMQTPRMAARVALHENLHQTVTGGADVYQRLTPLGRAATEQATEAEARVLFDAFRQRYYPGAYVWRDGDVVLYAHLTSREFAWAARTCGATTWRNRCVYRLVGRQFLTPAVYRVLR